MNSKQKHILKTLITTNGLRYSQLGKDFKIDDKYPYHLKYLLKQGLVNKRDQRYYITKSGVKASALFDRQTLSDIQSPSLLLALICQYKDKFYLKNHFSSDVSRKPYLCIPTGRPQIGMTLEESCFREAQRKYKIEASFKYCATFHLSHFATDNDILYDTVHLAYQTVISEESFLKIGSQNSWFSIEEIKKFPCVSPLVHRLIVEKRTGYLQDNFVFNYAFTTEDLK